MPRIEMGIDPRTGLSGAASEECLKRRAIDGETSRKILAGFDCEIQGEVLHFSYDAFDQQNFADTANACLLAMSGRDDLPQSVTWNGYRADGSLVRLSLAAQSFLELYGKALAHKAACMEEGGRKKADLAADRGI